MDSTCPHKYLTFSIIPTLKDIFYFKNRGECDFVVKDKNEIHSVMQVCYEITAENLTRELGGLEDAMLETGCNNGFIITMDEDAEYKTAAGKVMAVSAFEWFKSFP